MADHMPFRWGKDRQNSLPLERFLPILPSGVVPKFLENTDPEKGYLLMPFGSTPQAAIEAARAGYKVLAAVNNPITRFLFRSLADPPTREQLQSALVRISSTFKGSQRLEPHILSLYETHCPHCGSSTPAQAFLWNKKSSTPARKYCYCSCCDDSGEFPVTEEDISQAAAYENNSLYHARALTRIAAPNDPVRVHIEKALKAYPARTVYALFTLINKIIGLDVSPEERRHLDTLLLHAFLRCITLSNSETAQALSKIKVPAQYCEENVWYALEEAVEIWGEQGTGVPVQVFSPQSPAQPGITIFEGRFRELANQLDQIPITAALMTIPIPNPGYWTLSALWTGWLWGQEQAAPLKNLLGLGQIDFAWHSQAVSYIFQDLNQAVPQDINCLALIPNLEPAFLTAVMLAGSWSGLSFQGTALDSSQCFAQAKWKTARFEPSPQPQPEIQSMFRQAGYDLLKAYGQPTSRIKVLAAGLSALAEQNALPQPAEDNYPLTFQSLETILDETFAYRQGFLHYPDPDTIWHQEISPDVNPFYDQVEEYLVKTLINNQQGLSDSEIQELVGDQFPGLMTPEMEFIEICLESYGHQRTEQSRVWELKQNESPASRRIDIQETEDLLVDLGKILGFSPSKKPPLGGVSVISWEGEGLDPFTFFISASAHLNKILFSKPIQPPNPWIVLPASRAEMLLYKLDQNPPLKKALETNWNLVKYRHLRRLQDEGSLKRTNLVERLNLDPFTKEDPQLLLI